MGGELIFYILFVSLGLGVLSWFATPKGDNRTVIRTSVLLAITCCYLMWAITYLAQLHPLIRPKRSDLRPSHVE